MENPDKGFDVLNGTDTLSGLPQIRPKLTFFKFSLKYCQNAFKVGAMRLLTFSYAFMPIIS